MKRSRVNTLLEEGDEMIRSFGFVLPPFANWSP
ncbi:MAG: D-lyxose/D-mannose family sugar isomerase, partial [Pseudomonadota bacterium]